MDFRSCVVFGLAGLGLTACGSSGDDSGLAGSGVVVAPAEVDMGTMPSSLVAGYDAVNDLIVLSNGPDSISLSPTSSYAATAARAYENSTVASNSRVLVFDTDSGEGFAGVASSKVTGALGVTYARLVETELPDTASLTYTGPYVGSIVLPDTLDISSIVIAGSLELTADFENGLVSGSITNRENVSLPGGSFADVTLESTTLAEGAFSGTTSGGEGLGPSTTVVPGTYEGLIVGPTGTEVAGGVIIEHENAFSAAWTELGAFVGAN